MAKRFVKELFKVKFTETTLTKDRQNNINECNVTRQIFFRFPHGSTDDMPEYLSCEDLLCEDLSSEDLISEEPCLCHISDLSLNSNQDQVLPFELLRYDIFLCSTTDERLRSKIFNSLTSKGYTVASPHYSNDETRQTLDKVKICVITILQTNNTYSSYFTDQLQYALKHQIPILLIITESDFIPSANWLKIIMDQVMPPLEFTSSSFDQSFDILLETIKKVSDGSISPFYQPIRSIDNLEMARSNPFIGYVVEWTAVFKNPTFKSNQFRKLLNNSTYIKSNKGIYNIFRHYDFNLPYEIKQNLDIKFRQAIEHNDARHLIDIYTDTSGFSRVLNEHLAIYGLHYFDDNIQENVNYQLIKCIMDFVALLCFRPEFDDYSFKGEVYRGMHFSEEGELYKYIVGSRIMNTTFLSTSKDKTIAHVFSTTEKQTDNTNGLSVFCTYVIVNERTALNIERLSVFPVEQEIIIMPFTVFRVEKLKRNNELLSHVEITLIECPKEDENNFYDSFSNE